MAGQNVENNEQLLELYRHMISRNGFSPKSLFYRNAEQHQLKLKKFGETLNGVPNLTSQSLVDIGCGFGALVEHLPAVGRYLGVDILGAFVEEARLRHPSYEFRSMDVASIKDESFDISILAGVLSSVPDSDRVLRDALRVARRTTIFDITLSERLPPDFKELYRWSLSDVALRVGQFGFCLREVRDSGSSWILCVVERAAEAFCWPLVE